MKFLGTKHSQLLLLLKLIRRLRSRCSVLVIYINLMQIMYTKHKHTLLRINSVIKLKLNLYFILFYFIKNNQKSQISKFRKYMVNSIFFPAAPQFHNSIRIELEAEQLQPPSNYTLCLFSITHQQQPQRVSLPPFNHTLK